MCHSFVCNLLFQISDNLYLILPPWVIPPTFRWICNGSLRNGVIPYEGLLIWAGKRSLSFFVVTYVSLFRNYSYIFILEKLTTSL